MLLDSNLLKIINIELAIIRNKDELYILIAKDKLFMNWDLNKS